MAGTDFSEIAKRYEQDSLIQKSAAEKLLGLVQIQPNDAVLDLGCGTGNLTRRIRTMTRGAVTGMDISDGMIREAERGSEGLPVRFEARSVEDLDVRERFEVIFCNSTFQWFRDPARALANCHKALVKGGRMGIQAPAGTRYCPNFLTAIEAVAGDPRTSRQFASFRPPWMFLDTAREYSSLFEQAGFRVPFATLEEIRTLHKPEEVMTIFESGAAAGYLNQHNYDVEIDGDYAKTFREIVGTSFENQKNAAGRVELIFNRVYLVAVRN